LLSSPQAPQTEYALARYGLPADAQPGSTSTGFQRRLQAATNLQAPLAQRSPGRGWLCALGAETATAAADAFGTTESDIARRMSPASETLNDLEGAANAHTNVREVFARSWVGVRLLSTLDKSA
jgi:hypothetical protein